MITDEEKLNSLATECTFHRFSFAEIQSATRNFDDNLVIGKGGFGKVYKGHIIGTRVTSRRIVAIKRLDSFSMQGAPEFMTEIEMLTKVCHSNLVSLIGYCFDGNEKILVYEYITNGTIEHHLRKDDAPLSWMHRLKISIGAAEGLNYLHTGVGNQQGVVHRDVKSSNILLDENWVAKIADFGLSKLIDQQTSGVSTRLKGTFGYLDPEYYMTGRLTRKSDVYSFGVVLFELLTGRRAVDTSFREEEWNLANWAEKCVKERRLDQIIDSHIIAQISPKCLKEFVRIAARCLKSSRKKRPTMAGVVLALQQSMALQEQYDNSPQSASFTHIVQHLLFGSRLNSVVSTSASAPVTPTPHRFSTPPVTPSPHRFSMSPKINRIDPVHLTLNLVERATQNFSPSLKLGEGGFGTVYKAQLPEGQLFAVKRAKKEHFEDLRSEFRSEVKLLAKIDHRNLVKLLGSIDNGNEHLIITEYVPNGTLRGHLDGTHGSVLDFCQRLEICIDIAHGLTYLHIYAEKKIIHGDIKSSNILLTERFRAKVADFGFARVGDAETNRAHVVKKVRGTLGYLDPEYMGTHQLTQKIDVFSFGVLLIEILTGRRPIQSKRSHEEKVTLKWAFGKYIEGDIMDLVDPQMRESLDIEIIGKIFELAFQCAAPTRADRPDMKVVGEQLWAIRMDYIRNSRRG
ncbi:uncharacterized protein LOC143570921 isoform X1 [Bidens hawaiensis]|uniref:uncharacterized protein LOC143570921 isoform X1 n=1 Tax=Bidens hawaiensis TaxID=980011 RepID=UPI00404B5F34